MIRSTILAALAALSLTAPARAAADKGAGGGFLSGMAYVNEHCPQYQVDGAKARTVMRIFGHEPDTWGNHVPLDVFAAANKQTRLYEAESAANVCPRLWNDYGAGGDVFPDILTRK